MSEICDNCGSYTNEYGYCINCGHINKDQDNEEDDTYLL